MRTLLVGVICLTLLVAACGRNDPIASANPTGPTAPVPPTVPSLILSGVVAENGQPIDNARLEVSGLQSCSSGCSSRQFNAGSGMTDAAGRYRIDIRRPEEASATVWGCCKEPSTS